MAPIFSVNNLESASGVIIVAVEAELVADSDAWDCDMTVTGVANWDRLTAKGDDAVGFWKRRGRELCAIMLTRGRTRTASLIGPTVLWENLKK